MSEFTTFDLPPRKDDSVTAYPIIFLDIDGVLNSHEWLAEASSCKIDPACVRRLNGILRATDARIVLSSAWRYMVHGHAMTLDGFHYLLRTHGLLGSLNGTSQIIVGITARDEDIPERPDQIRAWLTANKPGEWNPHVVIDDLEIAWGDGLNVVVTDGRTGLTAVDAAMAIKVLTIHDDDRETLASVLKQKRAKCGMTLRLMETLTGIPNGHLSQLETGAAINPTISVLRAISVGYEIPISELVDLCGDQRVEVTA